MASSTKNISEPDEVTTSAPVAPVAPVAETKAPVTATKTEPVAEVAVDTAEVTNIVPVTPPDFPTADQIVIMREGMSV